MLFTNSAKDKHQLKGTAMLIREMNDLESMTNDRILDFDFAKPMAYVDYRTTGM